VFLASIKRGKVKNGYFATCAATGFGGLPLKTRGTLESIIELG